MPLQEPKPIAAESAAVEAPNPVVGGVFNRNPSTGELSPVVTAPAPAPAAPSTKE